MAKGKQILDSRQIETIKVIRDARVKKNITQEQLAKEAGVGQSYIALIENFSQFPAEETLKKILEILGISGGEIPVKLIEETIDSIPVAKKIITDKSGVDALRESTKRLYLPNEAHKLLNKFRDRIFYAYTIQDNALSPAIRNGSTVIIESVVGAELDYITCNNLFVVAVGPDEQEAVIRKAVVNKDYKERYGKGLPFIELQPIDPGHFYYEIYWKGHARYKIDENMKKYEISRVEAGIWKITGIVLFSVEEKKWGDIV